MEVVCEPVDTPPEPTASDPAPALGPEPETPRSRGRPKGAPNKAKPLTPVLEVVEVVEVVEPVRERQKKEKAVPKAVPKAVSKAVSKAKVVQRDASPVPFEPTFEEPSVTWVGQRLSSGQSARRAAPIFTANFCHKVNEAQGKGQTDRQTDPQGTRIGRR